MPAPTSQRAMTSTCQRHSPGQHAQMPSRWWSFSSHAAPPRTFPMMNPGPRRSRGPNGVNVRRSCRSSGGTELSVSGNQSLTVQPLVFAAAHGCGVGPGSGATVPAGADAEDAQSAGFAGEEGLALLAPLAPAPSAPLAPLAPLAPRATASPAHAARPAGPLRYGCGRPACR